ncbi:MAG: magnesium transporter [Elusimicrobia bacterium]|nr:MAG: magnesium transporter [Elusimicrobiota bacterium]
MEERIKGFALFLPEISELLREKNYGELKKSLKEVPPVDLAEGWSQLSLPDRNIIFHLLDKRRAIEVFEDLSFGDQKILINSLESQELGEVLDEMSADERADLFEELPEKMVKKLFSLMKKEEVEDVKDLLTYEEDTAGGLMTTEFVELRKDMTARQAILKIQESFRRYHGETIQDVYITNTEHRLIGGLSLQALIASPPDILLKDIMSPVQVIKINVNMDQEEVAKVFSKYDLLSAPVVDGENRLLGIITIDDIVDVIEKEATEDIYGMGKISGVERVAEINYGEASAFTLVKNRVIWLFVLLLIGTFVSGRLLKGYAGMLQSVIALAIFIPMMMDSGGNAGAQSLAMVVRGLATGEVTPDKLWKIVKKEILAGLMSGILMGVIAMFGVFVLQGFNLNLAFAVGFSLAMVVTVATVTGAFLPLIFKRLGFDPAVAASPFITTTVDATCLIIYFEVAKRLMF